MNHPDRETWVAYVFGEATAEARRSLGKHLDGCEECRAEVEAWQRSLGRLDAWKLPQALPAPPRHVPVLKWAVAAALVLAVGFGFGRLAGLGRPAVPDGRAQFEASMKAALAAELQRVLDQCRAQTSNALAAMEVRMAAASEAQAQQFFRALSEVLDRGREEDRRAVLALFRDLEQRHTAAYVALRRDLETVASLTDEEIRQARVRLVQLAAQGRPDEMEQIVRPQQ